jgi:hypothetical protein
LKGLVMLLHILQEQNTLLYYSLIPWFHVIIIIC